MFLVAEGLEADLANVGIVIVSHSPKVAEGAADMVRQMVGSSVRVAHTGGNPDGGLGTDVASIMAAIDTAWSEAGVAIFVDLGGAETNSEMAIEMFDAKRRDRVVMCNAPIVEGAVIGATEASGGSPLETVKRAAEELSPES
jgi:PTS hybrid protein